MEKTDPAIWQRLSDFVHAHHNSILRVGIVTALTAGAFAVAACTHESGTNSGSPLPISADGSINLLAGQWNYLPGVIVGHDELLVQYRNFRIVEQDGSGGQANPPINEYGTFVQKTGDFAVTSTLHSIHGPATVSLDATPPMVSDEFRVNPAGVDLTFDADKLSVAIWDGKSTANLADQHPIESRTFRVAPHNTMKFETEDLAGKLIIDVNGKEIGQMSDDRVFDSHQLWFGFNAGNVNQPGKFIVSRLTIRPLGSSQITTSDPSAEMAFTKDPNGLQELANRKRPGFLIGADAALWATAEDPSYRKLLFGGNFGMITPENVMKWQFTEPLPGVYDFHESDALVNEALKNGLQVQGHNLVFSESLPKWVQDLPTSTTEQKAYVQRIMVAHITQLVTHFKGRVHQWDVIDEPIKDYNSDGNFDSIQPLRENIFYRAMGADYIKIALEAAHKADPQAKLFINDYGDENDSGARWHATYNFMKDLSAALQPQGIQLYFGFESHIYNPTTDDISNDIASNGRPVLTNNINALGALGIYSRISEMDAPAQDPGYTQDNSSQAAQFTGVLHICLGNLYCTGFGMWSVGPTDIWQNNQHMLQLGSVDSPFNQKDQPVQPVYLELQNTLR